MLMQMSVQVDPTHDSGYVSERLECDPSYLNKKRVFQFVAAVWVFEVEIDTVEVPRSQICDNRHDERIPCGTRRDHGPHGSSAGVPATNGQKCLQTGVPALHTVHETVPASAKFKL